MRLSLRWKLVGGFGLMLVLLALLGWLTFALFGSFREVQRRVFNDAIPGLVTVDEMVRSYTAQSAAVRGYLIEHELALLDQYRGEVDISETLAVMGRRYFTSPEERRLLSELLAAGAAFHELVDTRVIPLARELKRSQAFRILSEEGGPLISRIEVHGRDLAAAQDRVVAQSETEVRLRANQTLQILALVTLAALGIGTAVAIVLPRRLSSNLARVVDATRAIGRGDLDQRVEVNSGDEIQELAERLQEMQAGLKRLQQLALQDRELEIASTIQNKLLQRNLPDLDGVRLVPLLRQANLVGGDWYDADVVDGELSVVIGDASGKGIAAALMATVALSVLRAERGQGNDPARIMRRANQALRDATDPESFTTCIYGTITPGSGRFRWLNMGHTSPFLLRAVGPDGVGRGHFLEAPRNRVLGWFEDPGLREAEVTLEPGDRLILYTDGFPETKAPSGEIFGEHRLADAILSLAPLASEVVLTELVADVERFAAGKLDDDLTMLVLEFQGSPRLAGAGSHQQEERTWHSRR